MPSDNAQPIRPRGPDNRRDQSDTVAILLCTYNGAQFLPLQLASYESQEFSRWRLFVSDDGSEDATLSLLKEFQNRHGADRVLIRPGPRRGFVANFLSLLCDPAVQGDYYAFSDQDDIWLPQKLSRARSFLLNAAADAPAVYCGRTRLIDEQGAEIRLSQRYRKPPHFRNALAQSLASGNTMVLNQQAVRVMRCAGPDVDVPSHDWWIYLSATAVGGQIIYDSVPTVGYRMHPGNVIGSNSSALAQMRRAFLLWRGRYKDWTEMNVRALERIESEMTQENRRTFELFRRSRKLNPVARTYGLIRCGVYRQTFLGNIGLATAALVGKV